MAGAFSVFVRTEPRIRGASLHSMLEHPEGEVGQGVIAWAWQVRETAQRLCPVESAESAARHQTPGASRGMPARTPGRLRDSIEVIRDEDDPLALHFLIGSRLPYTASIEFRSPFLRPALAAHNELPRGVVHGGARHTSASRRAA
jgi:hypothetical protein